MSSIGRPPMPPAALISSTAISMEIFAVWPHSAPLPLKGTKQPILTLRPSSLVASTLLEGNARNAAATSATAAIGHRDFRHRDFRIGTSPPQLTFRLAATNRAHNRSPLPYQRIASPGTSVPNPKFAHRVRQVGL